MAQRGQQVSLAACLSLRPIRSGRWSLSARHPLVAHCGLVDQRGYDYCVVLQFVGLDTIVEVLIGVMRAGPLQFILNEEEAGETYGIEAHLIRRSKHGRTYGRPIPRIFARSNGGSVI